MEFLWNIDKLRTLLFNEKIKFLDSEDEQEKQESSLKIYQIENALSFLEEIDFTSNEYTDRLKEIVDKKERINEQDIKDKTELAIEIFINKRREFTRIYKDSGTRVSSKRTLELVRNSSPENKKLLNKLIRDEQLLFTSTKTQLAEEVGNAIYISGLKRPYIYAKKNHRYSDSLYLAHELGHAKHDLVIRPNYDEFTTQMASIFREVPSELEELKMIDSLKGQIDEVDRLYLLSEYIKFKKNASLKMIFSRYGIKEYMYSGLIAVYLFNIYKYNPKQYQQELAKFYNLSKDHKDIDIIKGMGIDVNKLELAHQTFYHDYEEEVDKIKKYI